MLVDLEDLIVLLKHKEDMLFYFFMRNFLWRNVNEEVIIVGNLDIIIIS